MEEKYRYGGIFCNGYILWIVLSIVTALALYGVRVYLAASAAIIACVSIALFIRCRIKSPENIIEVSNSLITIYFPGENKKISIDTIQSLELKFNKIIVYIKNSDFIVIPSSYWQTTSDMTHFIYKVETLMPNKTVKLAHKARLDRLNSGRPLT